MMEDENLAPAGDEEDEDAEVAEDEGLFGRSHRLPQYDEGPSPTTQLMVAATLLGMSLYAIWSQLDLNQFDDLVRTNLAKGWSERPYLFPGDMYWLPLPYVLRGAFLIPFKAIIGQEPPMALIFAARLPTLLFMWGAWRLLAGSLRSLGGDKRAVTIFTIAFLYNYGTFEFSSTTMSEPDSLLALSAALFILLHAEAAGTFPPRNALGLGAVLGLACLMRYENWSISAALLGLTGLRWRRDLRPYWKWLFLFAPAAVIAFWLAASAARVGDPLHFLKQGAGYVDALGTEKVLFRSIKAFVKTHPVLVPLGCVAAALFFIRRRRLTRVWWLGALTALIGLWTAYKLYKIATIARYAWEIHVLIWVAASLEIQDWLDRKSDRAQEWIAQALALVSIAGLVFVVSRQQPHVPRDLRRFISITNAWWGEEGLILLRDYKDRDVALDFQVFRLLFDHTRLVPCEWLDACETIDAETLRRNDLRLVIARSRPTDIILIEPPLALTENGWRVWRIDPNPNSEPAEAEPNRSPFRNQP